MKQNESILARTLRGEKTERVPVAPFIHVNYVDEFFQQAGSDPITKSIEVYDHFGFDIILRNCTINFLDETACDSKQWRVTNEKQILEPGQSWQVITTIRTPERELRQIKKFSQISPFEAVEAISEYYIKEPEDFDQFLKYQPPVPTYDGTNIRRAKEYLAGRGLVAPWGQGAFNMTSMYRKLDDLLIDPYVQKDFYEAMMGYFIKRELEVFRQYAAFGADMVCCGGNVANGNVVGPEYFSEYILPFEAKLARDVRDMGLYHVYHNCGDAKKLLPLYSGIGMNMYESLTPPPYGDTDLETALNVFNPDIILSGNIDQIHLLRYGSNEEIEEAVRKTLELAKKRGRFILATTDYFNENTPADKVAVFAEAAARYGRYDN